MFNFWFQAVYGCHIDDPSSIARWPWLLAEKLPNDVFAAQEYRSGIYGPGSIECRISCVDDWVGPQLSVRLKRNASVVNKDIHSAKGAHCSVNEGLNIVGRGDVGLDKDGFATSFLVDQIHGGGYRV